MCAAEVEGYSLNSKNMPPSRVAVDSPQFLKTSKKPLRYITFTKKVYIT